jgi:hypothetical protein
MVSTFVTMDTARANARPRVTAPFMRGLALAVPMGLSLWAALFALVLILAF